VLVPYSKYQLVACPFGLTVPVTVADVGLTVVTGPVIAPGAEAAAADPASAARNRMIPASAAVVLLAPTMRPGW